MAVSLDQFGRSLANSRLFTADEVKALWSAYPTDARPHTAQEFADRLVAADKLTPFQAAELLAGRAELLVLGDYTLLARIGAGGMGQVFKALHRRLEKIVAIKVLAERVMQNPDAVKRFQREVRAAGKVVHPNVVVAHDAGESRGIHYLVMEYVAGQDLGELVRAHGPLPVNQAVSCVLQAARGLEHAHKRGLIHRDIKPANLLIDHDGTVKILDLGLALIDDPLGTGAEEHLTGTGNIMGTVDFMSPEQALDTTHVDARTDIYSLGCTLYYLLTARKLYEADTVMKRLLAHREAPIPSLGTTRVEIPPTLDAVFQRMVAKRAAERYADMSEVLRALQSAAPTAQKSLADTSNFEAASAGESSGLKAFLHGLSVQTTPLAAVSSTRDDTTSKHSPDLMTVDLPSPSAVESSPPTTSPAAEDRPAARPLPRRQWMLGAVGGTLIAGLLAGYFLSNERSSEIDSAGVGKPATQEPTSESLLLAPLGSVPPHSKAPSAFSSSSNVAAATLSSGTPSATTDVLKDLAPFHGNNGIWEMDRGALQAQLTGTWKSSFMPLRIDFPNEYDLHAVVERLEGNGDVQFGLTAGAAKFVVFLNSTNSKGPVVIGPDSKVPFVRLERGPFLANNVRCDVVIRVRTDGVEVELDGRVAARYSGPIDELGPAANEVAMSGPFLRIYDRTRFHVLEIRPPSGFGPRTSPVAKMPPPANAPFDLQEAEKLQADWAAHLGVEPISKNGQEMMFALIPPGTFLMGNTPDEIEKVRVVAQQEGVPTSDGYWKLLDLEAPQHAVTISAPFRLQTTEVTVGQFRKFVEAKKLVTVAESREAQPPTSPTTKPTNWREPGFTINTDESPVSHISWPEAVQFCNWLSEVEKLEPAYRSPDGKQWVRVAGSFGYRLPTEAEWEHACRAGTTTRYYFGDDAALLGEHAWFNANSTGGPRPVSLKKPNPFGLFDIYGNLNEWCCDRFDDLPYEAGARTDPYFDSSGNRRVLRGSPFGYRASFCRSAKRFASWDNQAYSSQGFRVAQTVKTMPQRSPLPQ